MHTLPPGPTLNLGILAHVDAGKTSLTERLLHCVGVLDEIGSVDAGSTRTDTLDLERRRGITIASAVVSFTVGDVVVNLVDTPGHPDFIAEVERVLGVLDAVVLVVSAVEGVQAQRRVLLRALQRLALPTVVFVNKVDRLGARESDLVEEMRARLTPHLAVLGTVDRRGTPDAVARLHDLDDPAARAAVVEALAERDDGLLTAYLEDGDVSRPRLWQALTEQVAAARVLPVLFGSAITGTGVDALVQVLTTLLPRPSADPMAPLSGTVFKVERARGEKVAWARIVAGTLSTRDRVAVGPGHEVAGADERAHRRALSKVTAIRVSEAGREEPRESVQAGRVAQVWGLQSARFGDWLGSPPPRHPALRGEGHQFAPPTLETVVDPVDPADRGRLQEALTRLAEQDPLIGLRQDDRRRELSLSLYGEVQKEVVAATLAADHGVEVTFRASTPICVERVVGTGAAREVIASETNPFLATLGLTVGPARVGTGLALRLGVEPGSMPPAFFTAVEDGIRELLDQGVHGWPVPDCTVTVTHSGYWARQSHSHGAFDKGMSSTAADFRALAPLVLMTALLEAGTEVLEPVQRLRLEIPADAVGVVLARLGRLRGLPTRTQELAGGCVIEGELPAASVHELQQRLPGLTGGEGVAETSCAGHRPVRGASVPERPRTDDDPRDRPRYLLATTRAVGRSMPPA